MPIQNALFHTYKFAIGRLTYEWCLVFKLGNISIYFSMARK